MPDLPRLPRLNHGDVLIRHRRIPFTYILECDQDGDTVRSPIICQISSNSYFYATLLNQLASIPSFESLFYRCLAELLLNQAPARFRFQPVFSAATHRNNAIQLRVHPHVNRFDVWINRRWYDTRVIKEGRIHLHSFLQGLRPITRSGQTYPLWILMGLVIHVRWRAFLFGWTVLETCTCRFLVIVHENKSIVISRHWKQKRSQRIKLFSPEKSAIRML